jgi:hypothetical protein
MKSYVTQYVSSAKLRHPDISVPTFFSLQCLTHARSAVFHIPVLSISTLNKDKTLKSLTHKQQENVDIWHILYRTGEGSLTSPFTIRTCKSLCGTLKEREWWHCRRMGLCYSDLCLNVYLKWKSNVSHLYLSISASCKAKWWQIMFFLRHSAANNKTEHWGGNCGRWGRAISNQWGKGLH